MGNFFSNQLKSLSQSYGPFSPISKPEIAMYTLNFDKSLCSYSQNFGSKKGLKVDFYTQFDIKIPYLTRFWVLAPLEFFYG